jgi:hypothetical protein
VEPKRGIHGGVVMRDQMSELQAAFDKKLGEKQKRWRCWARRNAIGADGRMFEA